MRHLLRWLFGPTFRVVASGRLTVGALRWAAVPGRAAWAFKGAHPGALNALSFAHYARGMAARFPETAARAARAVEQVRALEEMYPGCVIFVDAGFVID